MKTLRLANHNLVFVSDIHGDIVSLRCLKNVPEWHNKKYTWVFLGDYIDGEPYGLEVLDFVMNECKDHGAYAVLGNHDSMLLHYVWQPDEFNKRQYYMNGGKTTLKHMLGTGASAHVMATMVHSKYPDIIKWLGELPTAIETSNVLGVHAGVTSVAHYEDTPDFDAMWVRYEYIYGNLSIGKVVVSGHTPTKLLCGRDDCPVVLDGDNAHYFIDAGEHALNRHLNVLVLDTTGALRNNYVVGSDMNGKVEKGSIVSLQRD